MFIRAQRAASLVLLTLVGCAGTASAPSTVQPDVPGTVAISFSEAAPEPKTEISISRNGQELGHITLPRGRGILDGGLSLSPDGTQVAFSSQPAEGGWYQIFIANSDGTRLRQVTHSGRHCFTPSWSSDGESVYYSDGDQGLMVIEREGAVAHRVSIAQPPAGRVAISSGEKWLAGTDGGIVVMRLDGSSRRQLSVNSPSQRDYAPSFSPDAERIAYVSIHEPNLGAPPYFIEINSMRIDGSDRHTLLHWEFDGYPNEPYVSWSPAGDRIAFDAVMPGTTEIRLYSIASDGSDAQPIANGRIGEFAWGR
jgi:Tol biopolymer transport system component